MTIVPTEEGEPMKLIDEGALLEKIQFRIEPKGVIGETVRDMVEKTRAIIQESPEAVVRCEDCKHWLKAKELSPFGWCCQRVPDSAYVGYRDRRFPEDFCSKGERKDNGCNDG